MIALSIKQPWAWMIATGLKTIETRTWHVQYRGELLIVSSKGKMPLEGQKVFDKNFPGKASEILYGQALAIATLDVCRPMTKADEIGACCFKYPHAWSWVLKDVRPVKPFDVLGKLGIYTVDVKHCIECGCTDEDCSQCIADQDEPCYWVFSGKCSRCFDDCGNPKKSEVSK